MLHFSKWKAIGIIFAVLVSIIVALPNVLPASYQDKLRPYGLRPMTLGLDLQGGVNILLEIDREDLKKRLTEQLVGDIRSNLREAKVGYNGINRSPDGVIVRITKPEDMDSALTNLRKLAQPVDAGGLFGAGAATALFNVAADGQQVNFTFNDKGIDNKIQQAVSQSIKIVEKRVNPDGVVEATIQQQGKDRIVVQLPGVQDSQEVKSRLDRTAKLTFHRPGPEPAARVQGARAEGRPQAHAVGADLEPRHGGRRRPRRCARRLRPEQPPGRFLPLQPEGCGALRQADA